MPDSPNYGNTTFRDFAEFETSLAIWTFVPPVLIVVGTVTNVLSIIVLVRKLMHTSTTMFYLTILAFADIVVLYSGLLRYWIRAAFDKDIRLFSDFSCKFHGFLVYFSLDFTSWILVAVTTDRCVSVCRPFTAKTLCTRTKAKWTVGIISTILVLANSHLFWTLGITFQADEIQCTGLYHFNLAIWPWIDFSLFCFIPFTIMITCNIFIMRQLIKSYRRLVAHRRSERSRCNSERPSASDKTKTNTCSGDTSIRKTPSVTIMLLSVNCVFLVLTVPIVIYLIGYPYLYLDGTHYQRALLQVFWAVSNVLQYLNNTIHFFLYCLTGPRFRKQLVALFKSKNKISNIERSATLELY